MYLQTRGIFLYTNGDKEMRHAPENMCVLKTSLSARQYHKGHWQGQVKYTEEETDKVEFYNSDVETPALPMGGNIKPSPQTTWSRHQPFY
jgi:hypothetical protein